jgi:hypothetical protein
MKLINKVLTLCSLGMLVSVLSCGHPKTLESITINPTGSTIDITGVSAATLAAFPTKFTAYGNFIHPVETVDISSQVAWTSNVPLATVDSVGNVRATGFGCGTAIITATAGKNLIGSGNTNSNAVVTQSATFNVIDVPTCEGTAQPTLAVNITGTGSGSVISSPVGINCNANTGTCATSFVTGTLVTLTATPTGSSTFGGWSANCTTAGANTCQIDLSVSADVTASFN